MAIMGKNGWEKPQCTVTAQYEVKLKRPTPLGLKLKINNRVLNNSLVFFVQELSKNLILMILIKIILILRKML